VVVENLVDTLGFSDHQYIAARHDDKDHEHVHVAIHKIHPETFRIHSPAWDHQKLFSDESGSSDRTTLRGAASNYEPPFETLGRVDITISSRQLGSQSGSRGLRECPTRRGSQRRRMVSP
jgi:hypothetical protein